MRLSNCCFVEVDDVWEASSLKLDDAVCRGWGLGTWLVKNEALL